MNSCLFRGVTVFLYGAFLAGLSAASHTLTVDIKGSGTVRTNPVAAQFPHNAVVMLEASPLTGWQFGGWSGDISSDVNPINVLMDSDKTITANFALLPQYSLTATVAGNGSVSPGSGMYFSNATVQLTATPSDGWSFHGWSGAAGGSANPLSMTFHSNVQLTAVFIQNVTITQQPQSASVSPGDTVHFSVEAAGAGPLVYQWHFDHLRIPGADGAELTLVNVGASNAGAYQVIVTGPYGSATSAVAILEVGCAGTNIVSVATDSALRAAIGAGGQVRLCFSGTVLLTNTLEISRDTVLDGSGVKVEISGGNAIGLFSVRTNVELTISNVALINGLCIGTNGVGPVQPGEDAGGAAIRNVGGTVRLYDCVLSNHFARGGNGSVSVLPNGAGGAGSGGALWSEGGRIELFRSVLRGNAAAGGGTSSTALGKSQGGAIFVTDASLILADCVLADNWSSNGVSSASSPITPVAMGGAVCAMNAWVSISNCTFFNNHLYEGYAVLTGPRISALYGGALCSLASTAVVDRARFISNSAVGSFGMSGGGDAHGGALFNGGTMRLTRSTFQENDAVGASGVMPAAGAGGAIESTGVVALAASTLYSNRAMGGEGGKITFYGLPGAEASGGAIMNRGGLSMTNCTMADNGAIGGDGGLGTPIIGPPVRAAGGGAWGGGIANQGGTTVLVSCTVASNRVAAGLGGSAAGLGANVATTNGLSSINASLVANPATNANVWGTIIDAGYNICSDGSAAFSSGTSFNFTDPMLLPLADNGGLTVTMALAVDSPAIDWVPTANAPPLDQRGVSRTLGLGADAGAFEYGLARLTVHVTREESSLWLKFSVRAGMQYRIEHSTSLRDWEIYEILGTVSTNGTCAFPISIGRNHEVFRVVMY